MTKRKRATRRRTDALRKGDRFPEGRITPTIGERVIAYRHGRERRGTVVERPKHLEALFAIWVVFDHQPNTARQVSIFSVRPLSLVEAIGDLGGKVQAR